MTIGVNCLRVCEELGVIFPVVENGVGLVYPLQRESLNEFFFAENFPVVAGRPAKKNEKVDQCPGNEAAVAVILYSNNFSMAPF